MNRYPSILPAGFCLFCVSLFLVFASPSASGEELAPDQVRAAMRKVADWELAHPGKEKFDGWVQGAFLAGLSALDRLEPNAGYHASLLKIAAGNDWKLGKRIYHADDSCVGQTYLELYAKDHDPKMIAALKERCDTVLAHPKDDNLEFVGPGKNDRWSWCDSLFMAPPAWMRLYAATGNKAYLDYVVEHWWKTSAYLYDPAEHLYYRDSTYFKLTEPNGKKIFWSRGNGWVLAGLARVIPLLPLDEPSRPRFEKQFREMAARIAELQGADGSWSASLLDPESCSPRVETSGTGFNCFGLAWGVNQGLLDRATYAPRAVQAWNSLVNCVTADGKLTHVQPIGAAPKSFDPQSTEAYGPGAFLLAGSEMVRLVRTH
jgi:rhamnogalacturonyl hydrolase YesR